MVNRSKWTASLALAGAALIFCPREALAEDPHTFVAAGFLAGYATHTNTSGVGVLGAEATITHYPNEPFAWGIGGFAQLQSVSFDHLRIDAGLQTNYRYFGMELGLYHEASSQPARGATPFAPTTGIHMAPFLSAGILSASLRLGLPVYPGPTQNRYGYDVGLIFTLKAPFPKPDGHW